MFAFHTHMNRHTTIFIGTLASRPPTRACTHLLRSAQDPLSDAIPPLALHIHVIHNLRALWYRR